MINWQQNFVSPNSASVIIPGLISPIGLHIVCYHSKSLSNQIVERSLRRRGNLTSVGNVCEAELISLFRATNELPEVRFEFPFILIGKLTMFLFLMIKNVHSTTSIYTKYTTYQDLSMRQKKFVVWLYYLVWCDWILAKERRLLVY